MADLSRYFTEEQVKRITDRDTYNILAIRPEVDHIIYGRKYWYGKDSLRQFVEADPLSALRFDVEDDYEDMGELAQKKLEEFERRWQEEEARETYHIDTEEWAPVATVLRNGWPYTRQRLSQVCVGRNPEIQRRKVNRFWVYNLESVQEWLLKQDRLARIEEKKNYEETEKGEGFNSFDDWRERVKAWA